MRNNFLLLCLIAFLVSACALPQYSPIVDREASNFNYDRYQQDLYECRAYAREISPANRAIGESIVGAGIGAAMGAILGSGYHRAGSGAGIGAGITGITGALHGAGSAIAEQKAIVKKCLEDRGYKVLD